MEKGLSKSIRKFRYDHAFFSTAKNRANGSNQVSKLKIWTILLTVIFLFSGLITTNSQTGNTDPTPPANSNLNPKLTPNPAPNPVSPAATTTTTTTTTSTTPTPTPKDFHEDVRVTEVYNLNYRNYWQPLDKSNHSRNNEPPAVRQAGLNDIIIVKVDKLERLVKRSKCIPPEHIPTPCKQTEIALYINGREIKGLLPESGAPIIYSPSPSPTATQIPSPTASPSAQNQNKTDDTKTAESSNGELRYHLMRNTGNSQTDAESKEHWADLLGLKPEPNAITNAFEPFPVDISVGLAEDYPVQTDVGRERNSSQEFSLIRAYWWRFILWLPILLLIIGALFYLGKDSDLLRDRAPVLWGARKPYSLSAVQSAWWLVLIVLTFIFIWMVTNERDFSTTALILLGIGFGTALSGTLIDVNKRSSTDDPNMNTDELRKLLLEKDALEEKLTQYYKVDETSFNKTNDIYTEKIREIKLKFPRALGLAHEGFFIDILSDAHGFSFHRFQMLVWTFILGIFFVISTLGNLAMPNFDATLLALMGISAGTYILFKIPENGGTPTMETALPVDGVGGPTPDVPGLPNRQTPSMAGADPTALLPKPKECTIKFSSGPITGGQTVKITGTGFKTVKSVMFGDVSATNVSIDPLSSDITVITPAHAEGSVLVTVEDNEGNKAQTMYVYLKP